MADRPARSLPRPGTLPRKILIANRGAIARRVVRACSALGIASAVVYSEADADAPYLAEAGEAWPLPGARAADTYLNVDALLRCLAASGADAVHPGYGFLAENAAFAEAVIGAGATFIGPAPRWLHEFGDKLRTRDLLGAHGFPLFPGSAALADLDAARVAADALGYPLLLKPVSGGGGIGMREVRSAETLEAAFRQASRLAARTFGDPALYLESWIHAARHVEFQLLADGRGNALHLYERECSIQRRHQKLIEEAPAPGIDRGVLNGIAAAGERALAALGYDNVATLETLYRGDGGFGLLEVNPRIQVEHGVTEAVTGIDLVAAQIRLACGGELPDRPPLDGFAVEARVYSEDPETGMPSTGRLTHLREPELFGVRYETGYRQGQTVTPHYDPLLAKVIGRGATREQAIGRTLVGVRALEIRGVRTNAPLLERVLQHPRFLAADLDTGFLASL